MERKDELFLYVMYGLKLYIVNSDLLNQLHRLTVIFDITGRRSNSKLSKRKSSVRNPSRESET